MTFSVSIVFENSSVIVGPSLDTISTDAAAGLPSFLKAKLTGVHDLHGNLISFVAGDFVIGTVRFDVNFWGADQAAIHPMADQLFFLAPWRIGVCPSSSPGAVEAALSKHGRA
jgi:hypothetical protein